jgi:hypothetical protein
LRHDQGCAPWLLLLLLLLLLGRLLLGVLWHLLLWLGLLGLLLLLSLVLLLLLLRLLRPDQAISWQRPNLHCRGSLAKHWQQELLCFCAILQQHAGQLLGVCLQVWWQRLDHCCSIGQGPFLHSRHVQLHCRQHRPHVL